MADISRINPNGTEYNLKDATARAGIESSKTLKSSVVTVTDAAPINAEDITVDITPIQDLHGYDRPWAGGAGKNKYIGSPSFNGYSNITLWTKDSSTYNGHDVYYKSSNWNGTYALIDLPVGTYTFSAMAKVSTASTAFCFLEASGKTTATVSNASRGINLQADTWTRISITFEVTSAGSVAPRVETGTSGVTIYISEYQLEQGNQATSYAPYSNICPIEGRTGAELDRVGKNLFDPNNLETFDVNGEGAIRTGHIYREAGSYTVTNGTSSIIFCRLVKQDLSQYNTYTSLLSGYNNSFNVPSGYMIYVYYEANATPNLIQVELGTQPTTYEPYQGQQYTASFGETVYGGKWHVTEGGVDKTHGNIASYNGETINEPWLSSLDEYVAGATPTTGAQVVYPLTTPTTISTPKQNVPMLKGINTVSADCGDVSLKYQPDNVVGELKGEIQVANSFVSKMALREGSGAKDFSYGGWSFRIRIFRSMGQISLYVENISASNVTEQAIVKVFMDTSDYRAPEELRPRMDIVQAATYTTPSGWAIQVYLKDDGYIMFTGIAPEVGASAPTSSNWNLVEPWATHQQAKDLFN